MEKDLNFFIKVNVFVDLSITKVRSILHGINYTGDYHAVVAAGGGERREWWKIIRKVADMHPDTKISDVLWDAFNGSKKLIVRL